MFKKTGLALLLTATVGFAALSPNIASAQLQLSFDQLFEQIAELQRRIQEIFGPSQPGTPAAVEICGFTFGRDLSFGSTGVDVQRLQKVLNIFPDTRVATTGPGSRGLETQFFATSTQSAVVRFQQKFGITADTSGIVGTTTRAQLNELVATCAFPRNLSRGSTGADVLKLQQFFNTSADTRVATTGPGSPGNETQFFGPLTENAAIRFQEKFRQDILVPAGVSQGTGFVGVWTRQKLNELFILDAAED